MRIQILDSYSLEDGSERFQIDVQKNEQIYLGYFLESFEGLCNYTTPNKTNSEFQVTVASDYLEQFSEIINFLVKWEL